LVKPTFGKSGAKKYKRGLAPVWSKNQIKGVYGGLCPPCGAK